MILGKEIGSGKAKEEKPARGLFPQWLRANATPGQKNSRRLIPHKIKTRKIKEPGTSLNIEECKLGRGIRSSGDYPGN